MSAEVISRNSLGARLPRRKIQILASLVRKVENIGTVFVEASTVCVKFQNSSEKPGGTVF